MNVRMVILNYNGHTILSECLPSVMKAVESSCHQIRLTILDNGSTDASESLIVKNYPKAEYIHAPSNDFLCSFNWYARQIDDEAMLLMNNDLKLDENFCDPLIDAMQSDPDVFFCAPKSMTFDGTAYEGSLSKCEIRHGLIWGSARFDGHEALINKKSLTLQCGFGLFHRKRFLELGGYDDLYLPGTVEDTDLCYRGYLSGWKGIYCPQSICFHMGQASFGKVFGNAGIRRINRRNRHLFMWKNIRSFHIWTEYLAWTPIHLLRQLITGSYPEILGLADAVKKFSLAMQKRRKTFSTPYKRSDADVFEISRKIGKSCE